MTTFLSSNKLQIQLMQINTLYYYSLVLALGHQSHSFCFMNDHMSNAILHANASYDTFFIVFKLSYFVNIPCKVELRMYFSDHSFIHQLEMMLEEMVTKCRELKQ